MTGPLEAFLRAGAERAILYAPTRLEGKFIGFYLSTLLIAHRSTWTVSSRTGGFPVGRVEWSPQWGAWMFRPFPDAVFDLRCLTEVYVFMKGLRDDRD